MMRASFDILNHHPVNEARRAKGLKPANSIWFWSPGKKPALPSFSEKWGISGAVISAVDLIKGIGLCAGMKSIDVDGVTGNVYTNYKGKADAAIKAFEDGTDFVYVHVEAPDECGHRAETENKVLAIHRIDTEILGPVVGYLQNTGEHFKVMVLPDHPTPICVRTHTSDDVPYLLYDSTKPVENHCLYNEAEAATTGKRVAKGHEMIHKLFADEE